MSSPDDDLLTASEGVDEGSADLTTEGPRDGDPGLGSGVAGGEQGESDPAPPDAVETDESRDAQGTASGQQLEAGEG
ncbi:MAG: hypothetical protein KY451_08605 [Actinobacteria bacterium]|nr:hypothetical protein [Actinomycetota bacterium]MBW3646565.1 hypothetical protein [Actinomycetota bacterium]